MKTPLYVVCDKCGKENFLFFRLHDTEVSGNCPCGNRLSYCFSNDITIGFKILEKSRYEYRKNEDYNLSIVYAAMAFDCELSRLYLKWKNLDSKISDGDIEKKLTKWNITKKINEVSQSMVSSSFECFVSNHTDFLDTIKKGYPSLELNNLVKSIQEKLFWPRNRILHRGQTTYGDEDAKRCFNIAKLGLDILRQMDKEKIEESI